MAHHLQHPRMQFIGTGQYVTVNGSGNNTEYVLYGTHNPPTAAGSETPNATANLVVNDPKAFRGTIDLGPFSAVTLKDMYGDNYSYDPAHGIFKLYQGNTLVDTLHLNFDSTKEAAPWNTLRVQNAPGGVYITDAYHGLSFNIGIGNGTHPI